MSSATDPDTNYTPHDIPSVDFDGSIQILRRPATIHWTSPNGQCRYLRRALLHVRYIYRDQRACLQLSVAVRLKQEKRSPRSGTPLLIYIYPQHIQTLSYQVKALPNDIGLLLKHPVSLQFTMSQALSLIVPEGELTAVDEYAQEQLDLLLAFAGQMSFYVYFEAAARSLPREKLKAFCKIISELKVQALDSEYLDPCYALKGKRGKFFDSSRLSHQDTPPPYTLSVDRNVLPISPTKPASNKRKPSQTDTETDTETDSKTDTDPSTSCPVLGTGKRHRVKARRHSTSRLCVDELPTTLPIPKQTLQSTIQMMVRQEVKDQLEPIQREVAGLKKDVKNMWDWIHLGDTKVDEKLAAISDQVDGVLEKHASDWDDDIKTAVTYHLKEMIEDGEVGVTLKVAW
jgi:hypothetical protein